MKHTLGSHYGIFCTLCNRLTFLVSQLRPSTVDDAVTETKFDVRSFAHNSAASTKKLRAAMNISIEEYTKFLHRRKHYFSRFHSVN